MKSVRAILLDIEGTIAPIAYVYDVLFPYARREIPRFIPSHWDDPDLRAGRTQAERDAGVAAFTPDELVAHLLDLMDRDAKSTGLKTVQGLIWQEGYAAGRLRSRLFPDVPPAIRGWRQRGLDVAIYSSGSVAAQRVFLRYTEHGDLTPFITAYFDTTVGAKREFTSYQQIALDLGRAPGQILFCSDIPAELDAAARAGLETCLTVRPGNAPADAGPHLCIHDFSALELD